MNGRWCSLLPLGWVLACSHKDQDTPTYTRDVAPILDSRCVNCHVAGGIAPFALDSYDMASSYATSVASAVEDRRMPPAEPAEGCNTYTPDPSLTDDQIQTILDWIDGDMPEGDAADATDVEPRVNPDALDRVDLTLTLPEPFTVTESPDEYRCFLVPWPEEEVTYVTGVGFQPDHLANVHHVISYIVSGSAADTVQALDDADDGPGYSCFGGPFGEDRPPSPPQWLGAWAPGGEGTNMPAGVGTRVDPGTTVIIQVHYNSDASELPFTDQSAMLLKLDSSVEKEGETKPYADFDWVFNEDMPIPAGSDDLVYTVSVPYTSETTVYDVGMHMHTLGQGGTLTVTHADGSEDCLLDLDRWDFNWQLAYRLSEPYLIEAGDNLNVSCIFDNPGDTEVNWGESTSDEMCLGVILQTTD